MSDITERFKHERHKILSACVMRFIWSQTDSKASDILGINNYAKSI